MQVVMSVDHFTPTDAPPAQSLAEEVAAALPLAAFTVLRTGDVFDSAGIKKIHDQSPPPFSRTAQLQVVNRRPQHLDEEGSQDACATLVRDTIDNLLRGNAELRHRLLRAKAIVVDIIPPGKTLATYGYPRWAGKNVAGLFWDHAQWPTARIALRADRLERDDGVALVAHEFAHALFFLALSNAERQLIYKALRPTFASQRQMDEAFALYSEKEFLQRFARDKLRAPGVYGFTRRQWSEDHLFTRFIRKLYFPQKPAAGPPSAMLSRHWMNNLGSRK